MNHRFISLAPAGDLREGVGRCFLVEGQRIALFRSGERYFAVADDCPHRGASLAAGCMEDGRVYCPMHAWSFDLESGACRDNPAKPVRSYVVRIQDGMIEVQL
jgi:NAD(P)H-dependent nitrite reductase small subunit